MKRFLLSLVAVLALVSQAPAQSLPLLTRTTALTGLNDSALTLISDSAQRTRAGTTHELFKRPNGLVSKPSFSFALDSTTGMYRATGGQLNFTVANGEILRLSSGGTVSAMLGLISGGAGNMTITAGTGNSRTMTLQTTTSAGTAKNTLVLGADTSLTVLGKIKMPDGDVNSPSYGFTGSVGAGLYRVGGHMAFAIGAQNVFDLATTTLTLGNGGSFSIAPTGASSSLNLQATTAGSAASTMLALSTASGVDASNATAIIAPATISNVSVISGRAGNTQIIGGTGAARKVLLRGTDASGTAQTSLIADTNVTIQTNGNGMGRLFLSAGTVTLPSLAFTNGDNSGLYLGQNGTTDTVGHVSNGSVYARGFADTLIVPSKLKALGLTAEPSTQSTLCINAGGGQVYINAAATCTVSSRRFKTNIRALDYETAHRIVSRARPVTYNYRSGGAAAIGLVAEEADSIDHRLATRDAKGLVTSVNYEQITMALLLEVRQLRKELDSLKATKRKP